MNYEEMLDTRDGVATNCERLPLGTFYKKLIDKKYRNVVELRPELSDNMFFCEALKNDEEFTRTVRSKNQVRFATKSDSNGVYEIELDAGNYITFMQLLTNNPAVVAGKFFVEQVIRQLADALDELHGKGVYQVCLAPQMVFVHKGDTVPQLLCHGSFYKGRQELYEGFEQYIAPEVLSSDTIDERSDVYALGKFMEWLMGDVGISLAYKHVIKCATQEDPMKRYHSVDAMMKAMTRNRAMIHSGIALAVATALAGILVWGYFEMMPEPVDVEFVKPAQELAEDPFDAGLTDEELAGGDNDTTAMTDEERKELAVMQAKSEELFRRQFTREAEKTLSKIYSKERMNSSEQSFIASSNTLMDDLMRKRDELISQSGMPTDKGNHIATEIINTIRDKKQKMLKSFAVQQPQEEE